MHRAAASRRWTSRLGCWAVGLAAVFLVVGRGLAEGEPAEGPPLVTIRASSALSDEAIAFIADASVATPVKVHPP